MVGKLLLLINSLEGGGAENVFVRLADHLAQAEPGWDLRLATLDHLPEAYTPKHPIERVTLDCQGSFLRSIKQTQRLITDWKPDVVLSFLTRSNCAALLALQHSNFRCVISERVDTSSHLGQGFKARILKKVVRVLYPRAGAVIAVSQGVGDTLIRDYGVPASKVTAIPNPVFVDELQKLGTGAPEMPLPDDFFVCVGRLVPNKGGDTLLRAFARHSNTERSLIILGEGPEREVLGQLASQLGISNRVLMPGFVRNPQAIVSRASAYVSASRSEGFPNALVEAMSLQRAVISTDCHSGPAEILAYASTGHSKSVTITAAGILVPVDAVSALASAMDHVDDMELRHRLENGALQRARDFSPAQVFAKYEWVLQP